MYTWTAGAGPGLRLDDWANLASSTASYYEELAQAFKRTKAGALPFSRPLREEQGTRFCAW
jgi:hypothetical protein